MDDKYVALTLKKDRATGFKLDFDKLYVSISPQKAYNLKMNQFKAKWVELKLHLLSKCRDESQDADQYFQVLYETIIKKFQNGEKAKVFGIYCLLFSYWCSQQKIKINIDITFSNQLTQLLSEQSFVQNTDAVQALKSLFPLLSFQSKIGVKSLVLKQNGQPFKKAYIPQIQMDEYQPLDQMLNIKDISQMVSKYQKLKKKKQYKDLTSELNKTNKTIADSMESLLEKLKNSN